MLYYSFHWTITERSRNRSLTLFHLQVKPIWAGVDRNCCVSIREAIETERAEREREWCYSHTRLLSLNKNSNNNNNNENSSMDIKQIGMTLNTHTHESTQQPTTYKYMWREYHLWRRAIIAKTAHTASTINGRICFFFGFDVIVAYVCTTHGINV